MLISAAPSDAMRCAPSDHPSRVLVVDDEPLVRRWVSRVLKSAGYEVDVAEDGAAAIAALSQTSYELVLSDVTMPRLDGIGVLVASIAREPTVPVVLMTGAPPPGLYERASLLGAAAVLLKPMPLDDIVDVTGRYVRLHRLERTADSIREALGHAIAGAPASRQTRADATGVDATAIDAHLDATLLEMQMAYQPIVRGDDKQVIGHEALLRSSHPSFVGATGLLRAASRAGRSSELATGVRDRCKFDHLQDNRVLAINVQPDELEPFARTQERLGLRAERVLIELQGGSLMTSTRRTRIKELKRFGYRIGVLASEVQLLGPRGLIPDVVKLDMELVRAIDKDAARQDVCRELMTRCAELSIAVIALGVETETEASTLRQLGCDLFQGNHFGAPQLA